jgi:uncharacterized protein YgbK (DUF1537 family)
MVRLAGVPTTHLALETVRAGAHALSAAVREAPTRVVTVDAIEPSDLTCIARAALEGDVLPCGALGLARAWAGQLVAGKPRRAEPPHLDARSPFLIAAGSRHPRTHEQVVRVASDLGLAIVALPAVSGDRTWVSQGSEPGGGWPEVAAALSTHRSVIVRSPLQEVQDAAYRERLCAALAAWATRACREFEVGGLVLTGGETAHAVLRTLDATAVRILGELEVGIPWGRLEGGTKPGLLVVTKAGGFGHADSLAHILDAFAGNP